MVIYDLVCDSAHRFEGWFQSPDDYRRQCDTGLLSCPSCGSDAVHMVPAASRVRIHSTQDDAPAKSRELSAELSSVALLRRLHDYVEKNFDDVGGQFAEEARRIHRREAGERNIRGVVTPAEAEELSAEGIKTLALPEKPPEPDKLN